MALIYLNNAATTYPKPAEVVDAVRSIIESAPCDPARGGMRHRSDDIVGSCRQRLAAMLKVSDPQRIIFTSGATESLNLVISGLGFCGEHVVTTAAEHNSVLRPLKRLEQDGRLRLTIVECDSDGRVSPEDIREAMEPDTRAVIVTHASNVTGAVLDIRAIGKVASRRGALFIVDGSQSVGLVPVDVDGACVDAFAFAGHKALFGIPGVGGLYIREGLTVRPLKVGGTGVRSESLYQPEDLPTYYEAGTLNYPGIASLNAGAQFVLEAGVDRIGGAVANHVMRIREAVEQMSGVTIYGRDLKDSGLKPRLISLNIDGISPEMVDCALRESFGIIVRAGLHCAPLIHKFTGSYPAGSVRISPSFITRADDIEALICAIREIARSRSEMKARRTS